MTLRTNAFSYLLGIVSFAIAFLIYGSTRTMQETFGFNYLTSLKSLVFSLVVLIVAILTPLLIVTSLKKMEVSRIRHEIMIIASTCILGCIVSEVTLVLDERAFIAE